MLKNKCTGTGIQTLICLNTAALHTPRLLSQTLSLPSSPPCLYWSNSRITALILSINPSGCRFHLENYLPAFHILNLPPRVSPLLLCLHRPSSHSCCSSFSSFFSFSILVFCECVHKYANSKRNNKGGGK